MITLSTGLPGHGKTLYTISRVKELSERESRPVFYSGIKDLALPWHEIQPEKWMDCPDGSIIVIDECQRLYRPRGNGAQVPDYVSKLETHRHQGLDIFLVTQHPMLVDANVRRLTERHFHIARRFGMHRATILEFQSCKDQPLAKAADAQRHLWSYPTEAFAWYKSAEVHTVRRRLPVQLFVLVVVLCLAAASVWFFIRSHYRDGQILLPGQKPASEVEGAKPGEVLPAPSPRKSSEHSGPRTATEYVQAYRPRVPGLAYTAPVYDEVTKPTTAPVPVGAALWRGECRAYSQQGTPLDMSQELCRAILARGFFREWQEPQAVAKPAAADPGKAKPSEPLPVVAALR